MSVEENKRLMKTLDDAWNSQDWDTFNKRHAENVDVYWPGQPEPREEDMRTTKKLSNSSRPFRTTVWGTTPI